jgi:hypothetical protein
MRASSSPARPPHSLGISHAVARLTAVRSTVLVACSSVLREQGFHEQYENALPRGLPQDHYDVLLHAIAGTWVSVDLARTHYATCDMLDIRPDQALEFGRIAGRRLLGVVLGTMVRATAAAGGTPWTLLEYASHVYKRVYQGGGISIAPTGPKDARMSLHGVPFVASSYYRRALPGVVSSLLEPVCHRVVCRALGPGPTPDSFLFRAQWV